MLISFTHLTLIWRKGFWEWWCNLIFVSNREVNMKNNRWIVKLVKLIVNIEANNSNYESRRLKPDAFYELKNSLFLETGVKVVLEINICPQQGFSNFSTGVAKIFCMKKDPHLRQNLQHFSKLKLKITLVLTSYLLKIRTQKVGSNLSCTKITLQWKRV